MKSNPLKAFVAFNAPASFRDALAFAYHADGDGMRDLAYDLGEIKPHDPTGSAWDTIHVAPLPTGEMVAETGAHYLFAVQINERVLPGKVIKERLEKMIAEHEDLEGRKPNKKDIAIMKDQAETELLSKAFIKRSVVYVTVTKEHVFVWCSSVKRANAVIATLLSTLSNSCKIEIDMKHKSSEDGRGATAELTSFPRWAPAANVNRVLREILVRDYDDNASLIPGLAASFFNTENSEKMTLKDADVRSPSNLRQIDGDANWTVTKLAIEYVRNSAEKEPYALFTLSDKLIITGLKFPDGSTFDDEAEDADIVTASYLITRTAEEILTELDAVLEAEAQDDQFVDEEDY